MSASAQGRVPGAPEEQRTAAAQDFASEARREQRYKR